MSGSLFKKLYEYSSSDIYPFCMPGHKRRFAPEYIANPYDIDITEVSGFDDFQKCDGILGDIQADLAKVYGCENVFMSVNGSSACNLACIIALAEGGRLLIASNCHRSVFNACTINKREFVLINPADMPAGLKGGISASDAQEYFNKYDDIRALIVTSPTYEGFTSDIASLADIAHSHGALLIIDEAHGAHLPFCGGEYFPPSALHQGADIAIQSLHKTLPSLNQTSLVLIAHDAELAASVKKSLNMVMTTSPSYILMASAQEAVRFAVQEPERFKEYEKRLMSLRKDLAGLKKLRLVDKCAAGNYNIAELDPGKIVICTDRSGGMSGKELFELLLEKYHLQFEKYEEEFVLAMTSVMDTDEGFERLKRALFDIDKTLSG